MDSIVNLDCPDAIKQLHKKKPKELHEWIQLLREQKQPVDNDHENDEFREMIEVELQLVVDKALDLVKYLLKHPCQLKHGIGLIRDMLGHNPLLFNTIQLSSDELEIIMIAIKSRKYESYPLVILTRYIESNVRESFVNPVIKYANQLDNEMAWAMTGEACETLAFLNCHPENSMRCLAKHLNDGGCDGYPAGSIIKSIHVFKKFGMLIVDELVEYLQALGEDVGGTYTDVKYISYFIESKEVALKLIEPVKNALKISDFNGYIIKNGLWDDDSFAVSTRLVLTLYGQLQAIVHGDV